MDARIIWYPSSVKKKMLTKKELLLSDPLNLFGEDKSEKYYNSRERNHSLSETLSSKPDDSPIWVFAYGSLMWNPIIDYAEKSIGCLHGWQRAFCMKLNSGRASKDKEGRMLALVPGGSTTGLVYRLYQDKIEEALKILWLREMSTASYKAIWQKVELESNCMVTALVFIMHKQHHTYDAQYQPRKVSHYIANAIGKIGTNADYLFSLKDCLNRLNISDSYIEETAEEVFKIKNNM